MNLEISDNAWRLVKFWGGLVIASLFVISIVLNYALFKKVKKSSKVKTELKFQYEIDSLKAHIERQRTYNLESEKLLKKQIEAYRKQLENQVIPTSKPRKFQYRNKNDINLLLKDIENHNKYKFLTDSLH